MDTLKFDEHGLIPAVVQDRLTGEVRMVAYMNREASGNTLHVRELYADCDADTLLVLADPVGNSCHTGQPSCFFRHLDAAGVHDEIVPASTFLTALEREIDARKQSTAQKSYTKSLLDAGA